VWGVGEGETMGIATPTFFQFPIYSTPKLKIFALHPTLHTPHPFEEMQAIGSIFTIKINQKDVKSPESLA
jgi:hypothetical protein